MSDDTPDMILEKYKGRLKDVVIIGFDHDGDEVFCSNVADGGTVLWMTKRVEKKLLEVPEREDLDEIISSLKN